MFIFFTPLVLQPTGVTDKSKTLLDNIIFNSFEFTTLSGNITHAVSNQLIQFVILEDFITPKPPSKSNVYKWSFDHFDGNKLKVDLHKTDLINKILKSGNEINEIFNIFYKTLSEIVDCHAALTEITIKERTLLPKPWLNKEIKHLMWKREKFFHNYCARRTETQKQLLNKEFLKIKKKCNLFNLTVFLTGIWQLITLKYKSKVHPNIVRVKSKNITNPTDIANIFNNFFIDIGSNLSKTIPDSSKLFRNFHKNSLLNSLLLKPTNKDEVRKLVSQLNKGKTLSPLSIPVTILKDNVNILSNPPTSIINQSFDEDFFPESLKTTQLKPVNKKRRHSLY